MFLQSTLSVFVAVDVDGKLVRRQKVMLEATWPCSTACRSRERYSDDSCSRCPTLVISTQALSEYEANKPRPADGPSRPFIVGLVSRVMSGIIQACLFGFVGQ